MSDIKCPDCKWSECISEPTTVKHWFLGRQFIDGIWVCKLKPVPEQPNVGSFDWCSKIEACGDET